MRTKHTSRLLGGKGSLYFAEISVKLLAFLVNPDVTCVISLCLSIFCSMHLKGAFNSYFVDSET